MSAFEDASDNFRFSASVAGYGMILRESEYKGDMNLKQVLEWAGHSKGKDSEGYRAEFIRMIESTMLISNI